MHVPYDMHVHVHVPYDMHVHVHVPYDMHVQVSATYADGYRATSVSPVIGPRVVNKCQKVADAILSR